MRLGEFGAAQKELDGERDEFGFFGRDFTVAGAIPAVLMLQLSASVTGKIDEAEGMAAIWEALRVSLTVPGYLRPAVDGEKADDNGEIEVEADPKPFNDFYKLAVEKQCDMEALMRLVFALFEAQTGRPTRQVSASSPGQSPTSPSSSTSSTHPALSHLRAVGTIAAGTPVTAGETAVLGDGTVVQIQPVERTG